MTSRAFAREATGFLYAVSSLGVTGERSEITTDVGALVGRVRTVNPTLPCAVGFGISTPAQAAAMAAASDGAIVGSALVRMVGEYGTACVGPVVAVAREMADAVHAAQAPPAHREHPDAPRK